VAKERKAEGGEGGGGKLIQTNQLLLNINHHRLITGLGLPKTHTPPPGHFHDTIADPHLLPFALGAFSFFFFPQKKRKRQGRLYYATQPRINEREMKMGKRCTGEGGVFFNGRREIEASKNSGHVYGKGVPTSRLRSESIGLCQPAVKITN
jgi:hypothetical protein